MSVRTMTTNGSGPTTNGYHQQKKSIPAVTLLLSNFIANASTSLLDESLCSKLKELLLDYVAVTSAGAQLAPSTEPILSGLSSFSSLFADAAPVEGKGCTVLTKGQSFSAPIAALINGALGHSLDFDDTHALATLHAGVSVIPAALACSEHMLKSSSIRVSVDNLLLALALGYETVTRIGIALGTASYPRGFHNTGVAGLFGAVAAVASLKKLSAEQIKNAFGIAGSKAGGSMQYLSNGSWNKRLHPGFAAFDAFLCTSLAESGVIGADAAIEGDLGVLHAHSEKSASDIDWDRLVQGFDDGSTKVLCWEFLDTALKPWAGCRMTHGFIELAGRAREELLQDGIEVDRIKCYMAPPNIILVGRPTPNKIHPQNMVDAQFSCFFQVACALVYGPRMDMSPYSRLDDPKIHALCDAIECLPDNSMDKMMCRMSVQDVRGKTSVFEIREPLGEPEHPFKRVQVEAKFRGLSGPVYGHARTEQILHTVCNLQEIGVQGLLDLVK